MPKHSTTLDTNASSDELIKDEMSDKIISAAEKIATSSGPEALTVRKILQHLAITNRVFYNRFHNISEVLDIVYQNTIQKIRDTIPTEFDPDKDFFEQVIDFVANTLVISYRAKNHFNYYVFENDSVSDYNYRWWMQKIREIIEYAKEKGCATAGITCNPDSRMHPLCDVTIAPYVGPEVITGSSRLKAGTAQKLVLNMLSTGAMVKTGKVVGNLMVNVRPTNVKLRDRCIRILMELGECDRTTAEALIDKHGDIRASLAELGIRK